MLLAYGHKCACLGCNESREEFLVLDHIHGGGNKERKKYAGDALYLKLQREGWPTDKHRVLCANCNTSLAYRGYCPHNKSFVDQENEKSQYPWIEPLSFLERRFMTVQ